MVPQQNIAFPQKFPVDRGLKFDYKPSEQEATEAKPLLNQERDFVPLHYFRPICFDTFPTSALSLSLPGSSFTSCFCQIHRHPQVGVGARTLRPTEFRGGQRQRTLKASLLRTDVGCSL